MIQFKDLPSTETPINAGNLNANFSEMGKKNEFMLINLSTKQPISGTTTQKVLFNRLVSSNGENLSFTDNGIKIGKNISKVRVDLTLWLENDAQGYIAFYINKNSVGQTYNLIQGHGSNNDWTSINWTTANAFTFLNVEEGDIISASVRAMYDNSSRNQVSGHYDNACNLSVQVMK